MAPAEIPGYYFDPVRKKYFKVPKNQHGAGQTVGGKSPEVAEESLPRKRQKRSISGGGGVLHLLGQRQVSGLSSAPFQRRWMEGHSLEPQIWEYKNCRICGGVVADFEQFSVETVSDEGSLQANVLLTGNKLGFIQSFEVLPASLLLDDAAKLRKLQRQPWKLQHSELSKVEQREAPQLLGGPSELMRSTITSIRRLQGADNLNRAVVSGLGWTGMGHPPHHGTAGLSVVEVIGIHNESMFRIYRRAMYCPQLEISTCKSNPTGTRVAVGTRRGPALISVESGNLQWLRRRTYATSTFALGFDRTGDIIFCGFADGRIDSIDIRDHHLPGSAMEMDSCVCSIVAMESNEFYLLASTMKGQIQRWDRRYNRMPVCCYEGNVNSSSLLQLGVDGTETLLLSGGEDRAVRIWSLASGRLLEVRKNFPGIVTCMRRPIFTGWSEDVSRGLQHKRFAVNHSWAMWMAPQSDSLFYMHSTGG